MSNRNQLLSITAASFALIALNCSADADSAGTSAAGNTGTSSAGTTNTAGAPGNAGASGTGHAGGSPIAGFGTTGGTPASAGSTGVGGTTPAGGGGATGGSSLGGAGPVAGTGGIPSGGSGGRRGGGGGSGGNGGSAGSAGSAGSGGNAGGGGTPGTCNMGTQRSGGTQHCSNSIGNLSGGYSYQLWSNGVGSGCMTPYGVDATFKANWSNVGDFLARAGLGWNSTQTHDQLGTIASDFAFTKTGSGGGFSYIGIYGWTVDPLVEFYIVEDWFGNSRPNGGGTKQGTFTVDGASYDVYTHTQVNQPSITGQNATFPQIFSVRQTARQCGHISISEHFKQWTTKMGQTLGKMEEARILVEVGGGTGSIDFTMATVTATK